MGARCSTLHGTVWGLLRGHQQTTKWQVHSSGLWGAYLGKTEPVREWRKIGEDLFLKFD